MINKNKIQFQSYNWLLQICTQQDIEKYEIPYIYKLLFRQWIKTQNGLFFEGVAKQIEYTVGQIDETAEVRKLL